MEIEGSEANKPPEEGGMVSSGSKGATRVVGGVAEASGTPEKEGEGVVGVGAGAGSSSCINNNGSSLSNNNSPPADDSTLRNLQAGAQDSSSDDDSVAQAVATNDSQFEEAFADAEAQLAASVPEAASLPQAAEAEEERLWMLDEDHEAALNEALRAEERRIAQETPEAATKRKRGGSANSASTTARKKSRSKMKVPPIGPGRRVKIRKEHLFHLLNDMPEAQNMLRKVPNSQNYYGTVVGSSGSKVYKVNFDDLPHGHQLVERVERKKLTVIAPGEEEPLDHPPPIEECGEIKKKSAPTPAKQSVEEFLGGTEEDIAHAQTSNYKFGPGDEDFIKWTILKDTEAITEDPLEAQDFTEFKKNIPWDKDPEKNDYNDTFFGNFFPSIEGHAAKMDEWFSNPECPWYTTAKNENIKFHDPDSELGPDWLARVGYTLLIAAASEHEVGIENLWKQGKSSSRHNYPDFGQYMPKKYFKAFMAAAPYCWCKEECWYKEKGDKIWDTFTPCLDAYN